MTLTTEQQIEMNVKMRKLRSEGKPEEAEKVRIATEEGRVSEEIVEIDADSPDRPPTNGPGSSLATWQEYATAVSKLDPEIIESANREDLVSMLEAYEL